MVLTKIELPLSNPGVRAALRDSQKMHRLVTGFFGTQRQEGEILFRTRVRGAAVELYLYSAIPVDETRLLPGMSISAQRDVTDWLEGMEKEDVLGFQLETMPFKKVATDGAKNSRRRSLHSAEEREAWLRRKAEQNGFEILFVEESAGDKRSARHPAEAGGNLTMDSWVYTGRLRIADAEAFRRAVQHGIGPGKAYGLGMLLLMGG